MATSTSAAVTAVFSTAELAQAVLENLDNFFDLLDAQRVCRQFRDVIRKSQIAQQRLFLEPNWSTEYITWRTLSDRYASHDACGPFIVPRGQQRVYEQRYPIQAANPTIRLARQWSAGGLKENPSVRLAVDMDLLQRWGSASSRWLQMFITQPPVTQAYALVGITEPVPGYEDSTRWSNVNFMENDTGLRWIDVLGKLQGYKSSEALEAKLSPVLGRSRRYDLSIEDVYLDFSNAASLARGLQSRGNSGGMPVMWDEDYYCWRYLDAAGNQQLLAEYVPRLESLPESADDSDIHPRALVKAQR